MKGVDIRGDIGDRDLFTLFPGQASMPCSLGNRDNIVQKIGYVQLLG
jgi:hypothetical protein